MFDFDAIYFGQGFGIVLFSGLLGLAFNRVLCIFDRPKLGGRND